MATRTLMATKEIEAQQRKERETQRQLAELQSSARDAVLLAESTELFQGRVTRELAAAETAATTFADQIADLKKRNAAAEVAAVASQPHAYCAVAQCDLHLHTALHTMLMTHYTWRPRALPRHDSLLVCACVQ